MATNYAHANYQEIVDFSTVPNKVGVFGFHTPDTMKPVQMLNGFYRQFRQVKYLGCSVKIQPAATLPMDPLGVSFESGDASSDPRDLLNPLIVKGCHGETINDALDIAYRNSNDVGQSMTSTFLDFDDDGTADGDAAYYSALSDPSFKKYSVLQPFAMKGLHPLVHKVVGTMPIYPKQSESRAFTGTAFPGTIENEKSDVKYDLTQLTDYYGSGGFAPTGFSTRIGSSSADNELLNGTFFTSRMERLGWLDTISRQQSRNNVLLGYNPVSDRFTNDFTEYPIAGASTYVFNTIPRLFMSVLITPPCYKSILTFRCVINHHFAFRGFMTARTTYSSVGNMTQDYDDSLLTDVATADVMSTSIETINGEAKTLTEGVM